MADLLRTSRRSSVHVLRVASRPILHPAVLLLLLGLLGMVACTSPTDDVPEPSSLDEPTSPDAASSEPGSGDTEDADDAGGSGSTGGETTEPEAETQTAPTEPRPAAVLQAPVRGAWVHLFDDTLKTRAGIDRIVDELADAGANLVIAQVIRRQDAYYVSDVLPRTSDPGVAPTFDVLAELLEAAHARGLQVHAWYSVAPTDHGSYDDLEPPDAWLTTDHGRDAPEADRWVSRDIDGIWSDYLDPALPEVQRHVAAVAAELVERYPVDGIHLDYVRYVSDRHGYHPRSLERFRADTGVAGTPPPEDPAWASWRRDRTTELISGVRDALAASARSVPLSAAVITWGDGPGGAQTPTFAETRTATDALQDWPRWVEQGLLDAVMPMNYFREHDAEQRAWFARWLAFEAGLASANATLVVPGIGGWINTPEAALDQIGRATDRTDGGLVYSVQQPTEDSSREIWAELGRRGWGSD